MSVHSCELRVLRPPVCMLDASTRINARWFSTGHVSTPAECTRRMRRVKGLCSAQVSQGDTSRGAGGALVQMRFRRRFNLTATVDMRPAHTLSDEKLLYKLYNHYFVTGAVPLPLWPGFARTRRRVECDVEGEQ